MKRVILICSFVFLCMSFTFANTVFPHAFEGNIIVLDNSSPEDLYLIGLLENVSISSTLISNNYFDIVIENFSNSDGEIFFMIGNETSYESFTFSPLSKTNTNLTFDTVPEIVSGSCGDATCSEDECFTCPADCSVNQCIGNNVCDVNVGEDCSNAPEDCGTCPDGNGGGGGSSGGGGGSSSEVTETSSNEIDEGFVTPVKDPVRPSENDEGNSRDDFEVLPIEENTRGFFSLITGAFINEIDGGLTRAGNLVLVILIVLGIYLIYRTRRRNKK